LQTKEGYDLFKTKLANIFSGK